MGLNICTIVTPDFVDKAYVVIESARRSGAIFDAWVLVTDDRTKPIDGMKMLATEDLAGNDDRVDRICRKYADSKDKTRWSLKPILMKHLIAHKECDHVIYVDSDVCFFRDPTELSNMLGSGSILLTPHWRPKKPEADPRGFCTNFKDGLFNAGCVVASKRGLPALEWWADACLFACEHTYSKGLFADQKYLDLLPIYFEDIIICRHRGYNLADWNEHLRTADETGHRDVPDRWPVSMVHFTQNTIANIESMADPILEPYLKKYRSLQTSCGLKLGMSNTDASPTKSVSASQKVTRTQGFAFSMIGAANGKLLGSCIRSQVYLAARQYALRLESANYKGLVCDYDATLGKGMDGAPSLPDRSITESLTRLVRGGLKLSIVSRRGSVMFQLLRSVFPREIHEQIWVGCYSGSKVVCLADEVPTLNLAPVFDPLLYWLSQLSVDATADISSKLSVGGQLSINIRDSRVVPQLRGAVNRWLQQKGMDGWRVFASKGAIDVLLPGTSKTNAVDALTSMHQVDKNAEILRIGAYGDEDGTDFEMLNGALSVSVGSVSLDLQSCWNFSPLGCNGRRSAWELLSRLQPCNSGFKLRIKDILQ